MKARAKTEKIASDARLKSAKHSRVVVTRVRENVRLETCRPNSGKIGKDLEKKERTIGKGEREKERGKKGESEETRREEGTRFSSLNPSGSSRRG